jgi:hypothetical protein
MIDQGHIVGNFAIARAHIDLVALYVRDYLRRKSDKADRISVD